MVRRQKVLLLAFLTGLLPVLDGLSDEKSAAHQRMVAELARIEADTPASNRFLGFGFLEDQRTIYESLPPDASTTKRFDALVWIGIAELNHGMEREAIDHLESAISLVAETPAENIKESMIADAVQMLVTACLRLGETENCCAAPSPESCIFPLSEAAHHRNREGSERAIDHLERLLEYPGVDAEQLGHLVWLFNLASMTLGEYPERVPERWRMPLPMEHLPDPRTSRMGPPMEFPAFQNIAAEAGVDIYGLSGGTVADDLNGDGLFDIVVTFWDPAVSAKCFFNQGNGTFSEADANLEGIKGGLNLMQADYDNDGDLDLFITRGAWLKGAGHHPNSLLENDGNGDSLM